MGLSAAANSRTCSISGWFPGELTGVDFRISSAQV